MTIRQDEGTYWVECDDCGDCHDLDAEDFNAAVQEVKDADWQIVKVDGEWNHLCTGCREDA